MKTCPKCKGRGWISVSSCGDIRCSLCHGHGYVSDADPYPTPCMKCDGVGEVLIEVGVPIHMETCPHCKGTGYEPEEEV